MFDDVVTATTGTRGAAALGAWTRVENAACARRIAAMVTMLEDAYAADGSASRDQWCLDNWAAVTAGIGAAQRLTSGTASNLLLVAMALAERFPKIQALFLDGVIGYTLVRTIVTRAALVTDPDALRHLDTALAAALADWEPMSVTRTEQTVDGFVAAIDPHAVRRTQTHARGRYVDVVIEDGTGMAQVFGTLFAHEATALDARLDGLADTVCPEDPRTRDQRRADAFTAGPEVDRLPCLCDTADCPTAELPAASPVVVYVVAHQDTVTPTTPPEPPDPEPDRGPEPEPTVVDPVEECAGLHGAPPPPPVSTAIPLREKTLAEALAVTDPHQFSCLPSAFLMSGHVLPGSIGNHAARHARLIPIHHPGLAPPEPRYRPSKKLADFVRCRDLTCRFPGCREPAINCELDHVIPWPFGATQAANLTCLCRRHHLLKTFWGGENGWRVRQRPDGTLLWTAPDNATHTTTPGSRLLFPSLCEPTAAVVTTGTPPPAHTAGLTMPRRRRTRAQDRANRITYERELNRLAAEDAAEEAAALADSDPPPF